MAINLAALLAGAPQDIAVEADPLPEPERKSGLLGGAFSVGKTGGNILGYLGDAFLAQAGRAPQYAPRLEQARAAEALENFSTDPIEALQQYQMVNPEKALDRFNQFYDNQRQDAVSNSVVAARNQALQDVVDERALRLLSSATPETYPAILSQVERYYTAKGMSPQFELPPSYDEAQIAAARAVGVPVETQARLEDNAEYRKAVLGQRKASADDLAAYRRAGISDRSSDADLDRRRLEETIRHNKAMENRPRGGASGISDELKKRLEDKLKARGY